MVFFLGRKTFPPSSPPLDVLDSDDIPIGATRPRSGPSHAANIDSDDVPLGLPRRAAPITMSREPDSDDMPLFPRHPGHATRPPTLLRGKNPERTSLTLLDHLPQPPELDSDDIPLTYRRTRPHAAMLAEIDSDDVPLSHPRTRPRKAHMPEPGSPTPKGNLFNHTFPWLTPMPVYPLPALRPPSSPLPPRGEGYISAVRKKAAKHRNEKKVAQLADAAQDLILAHAPEVARIREVLKVAEEKGVKIADVILYISDPANDEADRRWKHIFQKTSRVTAILDHWVCSKNSKTARRVVGHWAGSPRLSFSAGRG